MKIVEVVLVVDVVCMAINSLYIELSNINENRK
jgi:hypothetical protein